jgi:hypothetical protein
MKDWLTEAEESAKSRANRWWRDHWNDLGPKHQLRDDLIVAAGALLYLLVLIWPLYGLASGHGRHPEYPTMLGGLIGLLLASYAVMSDRMRGRQRALIAAIGIAFIVVCWGFGPM